MTQSIRSNLKQFMAAAALALAVPLTASAISGEPGCAGGDAQERRHCAPGAAHGIGLPLHALNLSEAQRDRIFEIANAQAPQLRDKFKALSKVEAELRQLAGSPDYSEVKARSLSEALGKAEADLALARSRVDRLIVEQLTPEQRKQLAEFKPAPIGEGRRPMPGR